MRDSNRRDVRNEILLAADRLLGRNGYKKMTIDDLAREARIGKGSVYLHFQSKEEIALAHVDSIVDRVKTRLREIEDTDEPAAERLIAMLTARVMIRFDSVQHYSQSLSEMLASFRAKLLERRRTHFTEEAAILARIVADGIKKGEFTDCEPSSTADALITATNSLLPYSLSTRELGERSEIELRAITVAGMMVRGITISDF